MQTTLSLPLALTTLIKSIEAATFPIGFSANDPFLVEWALQIISHRFPFIKKIEAGEMADEALLAALAPTFWSAQTHLLLVGLDPQKKALFKRLQESLASSLAPKTIFISAAPLDITGEKIAWSIKPWDKEKLAIEYVTYLFAREGKEISKELAERFLHKIGSQYPLLMGESAKWISYLGNRKQCQLNDLIIITAHEKVQIWPWIDLVVAKKKQEALETVALLLQESSAIPLLAALRKRFEMILRIVDSLAMAISLNEIAQFFPKLSPAMLDKEIAKAKTWDPLSCRLFYLQLTEAEELARNGPLDELWIMQQLLITTL